MEKTLFREAVKKKMGKGDTISFWADSWLGRDPFKTLLVFVEEGHSFKDGYLESKWVDLGFVLSCKPGS